MQNKKIENAWNNPTTENILEAVKSLPKSFKYVTQYDNGGGSDFDMYYSVLYIGDGKGKVVGLPAFVIPNNDEIRYFDIELLPRRMEFLGVFDNKQEAKETAQYKKILDAFNPKRAKLLSEKVETKTNIYGDEIPIYEERSYLFKYKGKRYIITMIERTCENAHAFGLGTCGCHTHKAITEEIHITEDE